MIVASGARGREFDSASHPKACLISVKLNANRLVVGMLRGFYQFMNLVVENNVDVNGNEKTDTGVVLIRGNSIAVEALEPVGRTQ